MKNIFMKSFSVLIFLLLFSCFDSATEWAYKTKLPPTAEDVKEWDMDKGGWLPSPDFYYLLKAKINEIDFLLYCNEFSLTPHTTDRVYTDDPMWISWDKNPAENLIWWNVSHSLKDTYVHQKGDVWTFAKYENGYLYLVSMSH